MDADLDLWQLHTLTKSACGAVSFWLGAEGTDIPAKLQAISIYTGLAVTDLNISNW